MCIRAWRGECQCADAEALALHTLVSTLLSIQGLSSFLPLGLPFAPQTCLQDEEVFDTLKAYPLVTAFPYWGLWRNPLLEMEPGTTYQVTQQCWWLHLLDQGHQQTQQCCRSPCHHRSLSEGCQPRGYTFLGQLELIQPHLSPSSQVPSTWPFSCYYNSRTYSTFTFLLPFIYASSSTWNILLLLL